MRSRVCALNNTCDTMPFILVNTLRKTKQIMEYSQILSFTKALKKSLSLIASAQNDFLNFTLITAFRVRFGARDLGAEIGSLLSSGFGWPVYYKKCKSVPKMWYPPRKRALHVFLGGPRLAHKWTRARRRQLLVHFDEHDFEDVWVSGSAWDFQNERIVLFELEKNNTLLSVYTIITMPVTALPSAGTPGSAASMHVCVCVYSCWMLFCAY